MVPKVLNDEPVQNHVQRANPALILVHGLKRNIQNQGHHPKLVKNPVKDPGLVLALQAAIIVSHVAEAEAVAAHLMIILKLIVMEIR